jgi:hypothetical protein
MGRVGKFWACAAVQANAKALSAKRMLVFMGSPVE